MESRLDPAVLVPKMRGAVDRVLAAKYPNVRVFAEGSLHTLAALFAEIEPRLATQAMNEANARILLRIRRHTARTLLLNVKGLSPEAADELVDAALKAVKPQVNQALGLSLL